ncbi:MAG: penicillin-binding protein 1C [Desertifilum sp.]|nr:penicillin-binding protein 1C [Desertifilum sp.]
MKIFKKCYQFAHSDVRIKIGLLLIMMGLAVRSLPYLVPIRAQDIAQTDFAIEFSDRHYRPLGTLLTRDRDRTAIVPLAEISPHFLNAIIAAEDKRYYQHGALDTRAIARALLEAAQAKQIVSGASTITMQLARMLEPAPRTLYHKVGEVWLSWRLVAGMNKTEILQAYINRLPMGGNLYGVEAASRTYFGIPAADLNLAQASILAALPNDPTDLYPYEAWEALKQRQQYVLTRMVEDGYITQTEADKAYGEAIQLQPKQRGLYAAPHYLLWLSQQLGSEPAPQVRTTLDLSLQEFVETQVKQILDSLRHNNVNHAAAVVLDNRTGEVLAYVGSPDYFNEANQGRNDGVQALRQPGSSLKPFLYELALEKGIIQPNTILADVPTHYAIPGAQLYSPVDYSETFLGPVRVRVALANSLNVPAVKVLEKVTVPLFLERLHQLGFKQLNQAPEHYGLGLALGSGEVSLWELAGAYLRLARQGHSQPIVTHFGDTTPEVGEPLGRVETWQLVTDMLSDRYARAAAFGVDSVLSLPFPAAVKTGTSSDYRDTWTVGYTADYTVATWVGNFNGEPMRQVSGVTGAAPLWNRIMLRLHATQEPTPWRMSGRLVSLPICAVTGQRPTADCPAAVVQEYFALEDVASYQQQSDFSLSAEYNEWLATQAQPSLIVNQLRIVSPQPDDYFVVNPNESAKLELKLAAPGTEPVEWWLNGEKIATQTPASLFWSMRPGSWTLQVKQGEKTDSVRFQVEVNQEKSSRRGFSVVE